ncbi:MAG: hypothetical protein B6229_10440 [Spirochaetaceae bacterium 4572_7]|nr:MAG: hypothetical protein B6229_10440 [Spirochaetaceae bacterium 4572_7]
MTPLIKTLINDHRMMLLLLKKSGAANLTSKERGAFLLTVKTLLSQHLDIEDKKLYPKLNELAASDNNATDIVNEFTVGLESIGGIIMNFFDKCENSLENIHTSSDYSKVFKLLEIRIQKEEEKLYPLFDSLVQG